MIGQNYFLVKNNKLDRSSNGALLFLFLFSSGKSQLKNAKAHSSGKEFKKVKLPILIIISLAKPG